MFSSFIFDCRASKKSTPLVEVVEDVLPPLELEEKVTSPIMIEKPNSPQELIVRAQSLTTIIQEVLGGLKLEGTELAIFRLRWTKGLSRWPMIPNQDLEV